MYHIIFPQPSPPNQLQFSAPRPRARMSHRTLAQLDPCYCRFAKYSDPQIQVSRCAAFPSSMNGFHRLVCNSSLAVIGVATVDPRAKTRMACLFVCPARDAADFYRRESLQLSAVIPPGLEKSAAPLHREPSISCGNKGFSRWKIEETGFLIRMFS